MPIMQQRRALGFLALFSFVVASTTACKDDPKAADGGEAKGDPKPADGAQAGKDDAGKAGADGSVAVPEGGSGPEGGAAEGGAAAGETSTTATEVAPPEPVDPVPALLETAKDLETPDDDAIKALDDALAAGADKIVLAKLANTRGEALVKKSESDRADAFFEWAKTTHTLFAEPVFNQAKLACLAGDADLCKELLLEVDKRGNKKLLKGVGLDPIFTPVADDSEIRKLYEK